MIFDLVQDFADALVAMPRANPRHRILKLLDEAIRRDVHFIDRHPTMFFQCMWNTCWWYDCPEAAEHYDPPESGWPEAGPPWKRSRDKLSQLLQYMRARKEHQTPGFWWLRSHRPPPRPLGGGLKVVLSGHESGALCVAFLMDGRMIASGSWDKSVRIWDAELGVQVYCLPGHQERVGAVAFLPDGQQLASASTDRTVRIWDICSGVQVRVSEAQDQWASGVAFALHEYRIAVNFGQNEVSIQDLASRSELLRLRRHNDHVTTLSFAPDGRQLASGSKDSTVRLWDSENGAELQCFRFDEWVRAVCFSSDGLRLACGVGSTIHIVDVANGMEILRMQGHLSGITDISFTPAGDRVISASYDRTVRVWDTGNGKEVNRFSGHQAAVHGAACSPDGAWVASASEDCTVQVWSLDESKTPYNLDAHAHPVRTLSISPCGRHVVSGSEDQTVRVWDVETGVELHCLEGHEGKVQELSFSSDGRVLWSTGRDDLLWDLEMGDKLNLPEVWDGEIRTRLGFNRSQEGAWYGSPNPHWQWGHDEGGDLVLEETVTSLAAAYFRGIGTARPQANIGRTWATFAFNHVFILPLEGSASTQSESESTSKSGHAWEGNL